MLVVTGGLFVQSSTTRATTYSEVAFYFVETRSAILQIVGIFVIFFQVLTYFSFVLLWNGKLLCCAEQIAQQSIFVS